MSSLKLCFICTVLLVNISCSWINSSSIQEFCQQNYGYITKGDTNKKNGFYLLEKNNNEMKLIKVIDISHIKQIRVRKDDDRFFLDVELNNQGTTIMRTMTANKVSEKMVHFVDDKLEVEAIIQAPLGRQFSFPVANKKQAFYISEYTDCYAVFNGDD